MLVTAVSRNLATALLLAAALSPAQSITQSPAPTAVTAAHQAATDGAAMAATVRTQWPAGVVPGQAHPGVWAYEIGTLLDGLTAQWQATDNPDDLAYIKSTVDRWVDKDGNITIAPGKPFDPSQHTLDNLEPGRAVLLCYRVTHDARYAKAAKFIWDQFDSQPRTPEGGFWHKQVYPQQMWLDGAYMGEPFRAMYASTFAQSAAFDDIAKQLLLMHDRTLNPKTGLLRHGWDSSRQQRWADKTTGQSQESWARAMGWYAAALVDTIPWLPSQHPARARLIATLNQLAAAVSKYQDPSTGLWWDVLDKGTQPGNFREASASAMFVYALAKGVRLGYLPRQYQANALRGWDGVERTFISHNPDSTLVLHGTVKVSGLGGNPYRAGDYAYYIHEPVGDNDPKGVGAYLFAASEIQQTVTRSTHKR